MDTIRDISEAIALANPAVERISSEVWQLAEVSLEEVGSAAVHIRELEAAGFTITSRGTAGVPTAFIAEWSQGDGGPKVGYLPEYDACLLYTSPSPRDRTRSRMPSSA